MGRVLITPGARDAFTGVHNDPRAAIEAILARHTAGDWGNLDSEDADANRHAVAAGERILSAYEIGSDSAVLDAMAGVKAKRVWVITEADRSLTTVMLPSEY